MVGLGGPTFITDWARAVARFAEVAGIAAVSEAPPGATFVNRRIAQGSVEGFDTIFVKRRKLRPSRYFWRVNSWLEGASFHACIASSWKFCKSFPSRP